MLRLSYVLFLVSGIVTGDETSSSSDTFGTSLALSGTSISILNWYTRITLSKELLLVIIEDLIVCSNGH